MRVLTSVLAAGLFVPCASLSAQRPTIETGASTRVAYGCSAKTLYGGHTFYECLSATGTLASLSVDSVVLAAEYGSTQLTVPFASMVTFELSRGQRSKQVLCAGIGGLLGGGAGLAWAGVKCSGSGRACDATEYVLLAGLLAAPAMAVAGFVGDIWRERWEEVPLGWVRLSAIRQPTGVAFGAAVTF
jgi:hypothetical protein